MPLSSHLDPTLSQQCINIPITVINNTDTDYKPSFNFKITKGTIKKYLQIRGKQCRCRQCSNNQIAHDHLFLAVSTKK